MKFEVKTKDFTKYESAVLANHGKTGVYSCERYTNSGSTSCHSDIRRHPEYVKYFAGAYKYQVPGAPELLDYLTSEEGPYRQLMRTCPDGWSLFGNDATGIVGFSFPDTVAMYKDWPLAYSFLICSRMPHEKTSTVESFGQLIKKYDKNTSFLLAKHLGWDKKKEMFFRNSGYWSGDHEAFMETRTKQIDVRAFRKGEYIKPSGVSALASSLYCRDFGPGPMMQNFVWSGYGDKEQAGFNRTTFIKDIDKLVVDFEKFLELRYKGG